MVRLKILFQSHIIIDQPSFITDRFVKPYDTPISIYFPYIDAWNIHLVGDVKMIIPYMFPRISPVCPILTSSGMFLKSIPFNRGVC